MQVLFLVGEDGFEPSKRNAADLQSVPFGHSGTPPDMQLLSAQAEQLHYTMDMENVKNFFAFLKEKLPVLLRTGSNGKC